MPRTVYVKNEMKCHQLKEVFLPVPVLLPPNWRLCMVCQFWGSWHRGRLLKLVPATCASYSVQSWLVFHQTLR